MMNFNSGARNGFRVPGIWLVLAIFSVKLASAQVQVSFVPKKEIFIAHEAVMGQLTIKNLSGQDVILDGNKGDGWLNFRVTKDGRFVSRSQNAKIAPPTILKAGQNYVADVSVTNAYPLYEQGTYVVQAQVYFPPLRRYFESQRKPVEISNGQPFWSQVVGVPTGQPGAGSLRKHELLFFHGGQRKSQLYYRMSDHNTGRVLKAYSLGSYLGVREAQKALDSGNKLHVLHMLAPQSYAYTTIDTSGKPQDQQFYYEENSSRPSLMQSGGEILVQGGISEAEKKAPFDKDFHKISERPPGLPPSPYAAR